MISFVKKRVQQAIVSIACIGFVTGCNQSNKKEVEFTQLNALLNNSEHSCRDALLTVGNDLVGNKNHYLELEKIPTNIIDSLEDQNEKVIKDSRNNVNHPLIISGVLEYNDRPSHVHFSAQKLNDQECLVEYQLDYHFDEPCMSVREEAFKKWNQVGELSAKTRYYVHKRKPNRKAYLTNLSRNIQCLVSVSDRQRVSIITK